jgi:hypothetical protein
MSELRITMKKILLTTILALLFGVASAQNTDSAVCAQKLETYLPSYVIENYCYGKGLINIINKARVDDRIYNMVTLGNSPQSDSAIYMQYKEVIIKFDRNNGRNNLSHFSLLFKTEQEANSFAYCYAKVMGFQKVGNTGEMNAVYVSKLQSSFGDEYHYVSICFVSQFFWCF